MYQHLKFLLAVFLFFLNFSFSTGQDMLRVRWQIDSLCSPDFAGRGYTNDGDRKAAAFLAHQYQNFGLLPFDSGGYLQAFPISVNTFPGEVSLRIGNQKMAPGIDFLADPASGSWKGNARMRWLDTLLLTDEEVQKAWLEQDLSNAFLVYPQEVEQQLFGLPRKILAKIFNMQGHLVLVNKLTHSLAPHQYQLPRLRLLKEKLPEKAGKLKVNIDAVLQRGYQSANVTGYIKGTKQPDSFLVFTAHYDHLGTMGNAVYFPGGNDNASGVAMLLELAAHFVENPPPYSVAFIAFGGEEAGLVGSRYYTLNPKFPLHKIQFLLNLDLFGTGENGMMVVNATQHDKEFALLKAINQTGQYLDYIGARGPAANSDHHFFAENGVPAFFCYLMGDWPHYHDIKDSAQLPLSRFPQAFQLLCDFSMALMEGGN